jgi:glutaredoxin
MLLKLCFFLLFSLTPAWGYELIVVEREGCPYCAQFRQTIAPIYPKTEFAALAPLHYYHLEKDAKNLYQFKTPPRFTPTFVLIKDNVEVGRFEGFRNDEFFWALLKRMLQQQNITVP